MSTTTTIRYYAPVTRTNTRIQPDPEDLSFDTADEYAALEDGDGPILAVAGYDAHDADTIRHVAEWFDKVAEHARDLANELRDEANSICDGCRGYGSVGHDDRECVRCSGHGTVS